MFFLFSFGLGGGFNVLIGNLFRFFCFKWLYFLLLFFFLGGVGGDLDFFFEVGFFGLFFREGRLGIVVLLNLLFRFELFFLGEFIL